MTANHNPTLFEKIIQKQIPADIVHEDEWLVGFKDIMPVAPWHCLVVPKQVIPRLSESQDSERQLLGKCLLTALTIGANQFKDQGFCLAVNNGPGALQTVFHLHIHVMAGRPFSAPVSDEVSGQACVSVDASVSIEKYQSRKDYEVRMVRSNLRLTGEEDKESIELMLGGFCLALKRIILSEGLQDKARLLWMMPAHAQADDGLSCYVLSGSGMGWPPS